MRVIWLGVVGVLLGAETGMVFFPGGEFRRGRTYEDPETKVDWYPNPLRDDLPVRNVYVDPFYLDEHEATIGVGRCGHYYGPPVAHAFDGFRRLYDTWLTDQKPDCLALTCLG